MLVGTHHGDLGVRLFERRSEHHPLGGGCQAVAPPLGLRDGHGGGLPVALQEHQLPGPTGCPLSLKATVRYCHTLNVYPDEAARV